MAMAFPVLLLLDVATDNPIHETEVEPYIAEEHRSALVRLRATSYGAVRWRTGAPEDWRACSNAIVQMVQDVRDRAAAAGGAPYYYVAGRAALPLFAQLGCELSSWADVTLINRRRSPAGWDVMHLRAETQPSTAGRFFLEQTGLAERNESPGWVSVIVSTAPPRQDAEAELYMSLQDEPQAGVVRLSAHTATPTGPARGDLDGNNVSRAEYEIEQALGALSATFPNHRGLALFIDGPASLAFLVGRALNPNVIRHPARVPNFSPMEGGGYYEAVTLPHRVRPGTRGSSDAVAIALLHVDADEGFLRTFETGLAPKVRNGSVRLWHRGNIEPGADRDEAVRSALEEARIVIPLLSADFLGEGSFVTHVERLARAHRALGKKVVPILVRDCSLTDTLLEKVQMLPRSGQAIGSKRNLDKMWKEVLEEVFRVISEVAAERRDSDKSI